MRQSKNRSRWESLGLNKTSLCKRELDGARCVDGVQELLDRQFSFAKI
jgi:hypothetical protein